MQKHQKKEKKINCYYRIFFFKPQKKEKKEIVTKCCFLSTLSKYSNSYTVVKAYFNVRRPGPGQLKLNFTHI